MKYRKKPVVVEAWRLPMSDGASRAFDNDPNIIFKREDGCIVEAIISTLEGTMVASNGDWIIRGVKGELYPCKPDVFAESYEVVSEQAGGYWWLNRFNLIEMDGPFSSIEAAKADVVEVMCAAQHGRALDIVILKSNPEEPMPEWAVVAEGYIEGGSWFDGAHPNNRCRIFEVGDKVVESGRVAMVLEVEISGGSGLSRYKIQYDDDGSTLSNISGYALSPSELRGRTVEWAALDDK